MHPLIVAGALVSTLFPPRATENESKEESTRASAAIAATARYGDFDGDGLVDFYAVDSQGGDRLFWNRGDGRFVDVTERSGLAGQLGTRMILWQDYDGDGRLDLYVCAISGRSRLFQNLGGARFADVSSSAGISHEDGEELYAEWVDCDGDERPDLHVVTIRGDRLFHNAGQGRFGEVDLSAPSGREALRCLVGATGISQVPPPSEASSASCVEGLIDQAGTSECIQASSIPALGKLMPLSRILSIVGANVGIRTPSPTEPLDIALGDKSFQIRRDGNLVPGINLTGTGGNVGILRLRNSLEIWSDDTQTQAGYLDVRDLDNSPGCQLFGSGAVHLTSDDQTPLHILGSSVGGTWINLQNSSLGGNEWSVISTGSGNGEGPGRLIFRNHTAGIVPLTIDPDGWVGIGTVSPQAGVGLTVVNGAKIDYFDQNDGVSLANALNFGGPVSGEAIGSKRNAGGNLYGLDFFTGYLPRMQITNGGQVGIGRLPTANPLEVEGDASKLTAGDWLANSDRRIKQDVHEIDGALETLERIRPVAFRYSDEYVERHPSIECKEYYNVIAQEFAQVFPDYVKDSGEDGMLQVDTHPAMIHAIAALQELHQVVRAQESEIEALQDRLARLESSLATLSSTVEAQR